jgi:ribonuclease BN (tRNA processing enzyme)
VRLIVIGAGPAYTDRPGASGACYLVVAGETRLLLDLGQGSFVRLFAHADPTAITAVAVSHLHPDHFVDLVPYRHYLRYEFLPTRRLRVLGPRDLSRRLDALHDEPGFCGEALDIEPLGEGARTIGSLQLESRLVTHTDESYAFRVSPSDGPGLVYSGDCGRAADIAPLIRPGDTLLAEVSFGAGPVPAGVMHLDGPAVGRLAADRRVGHVLLTHLQMGHDPEEAAASVRAVFDGPVSFVWPESALEI